jgi:molecular chaperone DnaK (HSP70)
VIAAQLLRDVHVQVEPLLDYVEVVITVPSGFKEAQRVATRHAAADGLLIRREGMERLVSKLLQRSFVACDEALANAGLRPGDVRAVLLAGGSTKMPIVRQEIESYFGRCGYTDLEALEVVARGASLSSPG